MSKDIQIPTDDTEFEERTVSEVQDGEDHYTIRMGGSAIGLSREHGVTPVVGDRIRLYGRFGFPVRGIVVAGKVAYYRTPGEDDEHQRRQAELARGERRAKFEAEMAQHDENYAGLPEAFRRRVDRFRASGPDWRWEFEPYEVFCCREAVRIANRLRELPGTASVVERHRAFVGAGVDAQRAMVPDLSHDHSGNTFGFACRLAYHWLTEAENVVREHGALAVLVGCDEYGCRHDPASPRNGTPVGGEEPRRP